jgi:hypothetical protein
MLDASSHNFAIRQSSVASTRRCTSRSPQNRGSAGIHAIRDTGLRFTRSPKDERDGSRQITLKREIGELGDRIQRQGAKKKREFLPARLPSQLEVR